MGSSQSRSGVPFVYLRRRSRFNWEVHWRAYGKRSTSCGELGWALRDAWGAFRRQRQRRKALVR